MTTWQFTGMYTKLQANRTFHFFVIYVSKRLIHRLQRTKIKKSKNKDLWCTKRKRLDEKSKQSIESNQSIST